MLLPEVAVRLIMQDLSQDRAAAIRTLLASMKYGDSRFVLDPDNELEYDLSILDACQNIHGTQSPDLYTNQGLGAARRRRLERKRKVLNQASIVLDAVRTDVGEDFDDGPERKRKKVVRE